MGTFIRRRKQSSQALIVDTSSNRQEDEQQEVETETEMASKQPRFLRHNGVVLSGTTPEATDRCRLVLRTAACCPVFNVCSFARGSTSVSKKSTGCVFVQYKAVQV